MLAPFLFSLLTIAVSAQEVTDFTAVSTTPLTSATALTAATRTAVSTSLTGTAASAASASVASDDAAFDSAYPTAAQTGPVVDACGPKIPDPSVPDTCDTPVEQVDQPASYGVQCLNDTQTSTPINITSCAALIPQLCLNQWQVPGQWLWLTADDCSLGSFLPGDDLPGHAPWPTAAQCEELIYASMVDSCEYAGVPYNVAAVNLKQLPSDESIDLSGAAVNVGYGSYIVSSRQQRTKSDVKNCLWIPPDDYCKGSGCYSASYYQSKFQHSTPCAGLGSLAASVTQPAPTS